MAYVINRSLLILYFIPATILIMYTFKSALIGLSVSVVLCSISVRRAGWLDRVVEYQKKRFIDDLMKQPVKITARIEKAPPGYVDSKDWDYDSVIRLLTLIRDSEGAAPVRQAFRRAISTNRRFLSFGETFKAFPSLIKGHHNDIHYGADSGEYYSDFLPLEQPPLELQDVIVVSNPVEAKLPSATISVELLKNILESRAVAARLMPTKKLNISWPVTPKRIPIAKGSPGDTESASGSTAAPAEATSATSLNETTTASANGTAVNATDTANKTASY